MKLQWVLLFSLCFATAFALDGGQWIQVKGGSWEPDAATLSLAGSAVKGALESRIGHKLGATEWRNYSFQYQGWFVPSGRRTIKINAFCADLLSLADRDLQSVDLTDHWLPLTRNGGTGGGSCFFSANYDVATRSISNLKVNAPK
jgi:hypothetical protein